MFCLVGHGLGSVVIDPDYKRIRVEVSLDSSTYGGVGFLDVFGGERIEMHCRFP
jgi:hypothetical protein